MEGVQIIRVRMNALFRDDIAKMANILVGQLRRTLVY